MAKEKIKLALREIDLSKAHEHDHPEIKEGPYYLARINGDLYFGTFWRQWYGWNFDDNWGCSGHQFDAPGYNRSRWQQLWEIKLKKRPT